MSDSTIQGLPSGMYDVTVEDSDGCQVISSIAIGQPEAITASLTTRDLVCPQDSSGTIEVTSMGGSGAHTYTWSSGGTTSIESNLSSGDYSLTINDTNGCEVAIDTSLRAIDTLPPIARTDSVVVYIDSSGSVVITADLLDAGSSDKL